MAGTLRKKEARSIQLPPSSKKSLNFTHVGLKNTKLIDVFLSLKTAWFKAYGDIFIIAKQYGPSTKDKKVVEKLWTGGTN